MSVINNKELNQYELLPPSLPNLSGSPTGEGAPHEAFPPGETGKGVIPKEEKEP
jgi:hypothetical protein